MKQNEIVDLRSDTFTLPTLAMRAAMMDAPLGDDVFGEDPSINALEAKVAGLFKMEAALFCPSGTMCNQVAVKTHTQPLQDIIVEESCHIFQYEAGGYAFNSGVSISPLSGKRGQLSAAMIEEAIHPLNDPHKAISSLVCLENSCNKGGGSVYDTSEIEAIGELCRARELKLHLDGARLFNAMEAGSGDPEFYGKQFDSISLCLSKGLGAPVGSVLLGSAGFIDKARRFRKVFGGGMRQAGMLAAAGSFALDNHVARLSIDHQHAQRLSEALQNTDYVAEVLPVDTNIVIFKLKEIDKTGRFLDKLADKGILSLTMSSELIRFVTHLGVDETGIEKTVTAIREMALN